MKLLASRGEMNLELALGHLRMMAIVSVVRRRHDYSLVLIILRCVDRCKQ